ncbi:hypothetical protein [Arthrobacter sp. Z1-15]
MAVKRSFKDMLPPMQVPAPAGTVTPEVPAAAPKADPEAVAPASEQVPAPAPAKPTLVSVPSQEPAPTTEPTPAAVPVNGPAAKAEETAGAPARPHYSLLVRKELRVFKDQAKDLKILTMTINDLKLSVGERITDNTLVRVAIDLLLERKDELSGTTERELRESLGLPPRY